MTAERPADLDFGDDEFTADAPPDRPARGLTGKETANLISDTVVGVNLRRNDNLVQAAIVAVGLPAGALIGWLAGGRDAVLWAFFGGLGGVLAGLFGSGIGLMIYRGARHLRGRHD